VASRSRDHADRVPARPAHRAPHVLSRLAEDDGAGTHAVVARAVEPPGRVVGRVLRSNDRALDELRSSTSRASTVDRAPTVIQPGSATAAPAPTATRPARASNSRRSNPSVSSSSSATA
jgi:hypothetical protein